MVGTVVFGLLVLGLFELALRRSNPHRLWKDAFDEAEACDQHLLLGWVPKRNFAFTYYHRYLKGRRHIVQNGLGLRSDREFRPERSNSAFRILLMGETTTLGWELSAESTVASVLGRELLTRTGQTVEVIPALARNYSLGQLFTWYRAAFSEFEYDLLLFVFNENNPRRSVTFHESGKSPRLTQPLYRVEGDGRLELIAAPEILHRNDMAYMDASGSTVVERGHSAAGIHPWLLNHLHLYCSLNDLWQGKVRLRRFKDRKEIKDIEKWEQGQSGRLPFQWELCRHLLVEWARSVRETGRPFLLTGNLQFYHAGNNWLHGKTRHPWGFDYENIPSRVHLPSICQEAGIQYHDIYAHARAGKIDTSRFYVHPRYAYYSEEGAAFQAKYLADLVAPYLPRRT